MKPLRILAAPICFFASLAALSPYSSANGGRATAFGQPDQKTLAERLGYPKDAKLLIIHADDLGVAHSVNAASIKALDSGAISSGSIMVPCPWLLEIAEYARSHSDADLGLHLTLTSEWQSYRWGPVASKDKVHSLLDKDGYLYPNEIEAATHIDPREAEIEIRAQVERALALGIHPTHLDAHMGTLFRTKALFEALLRVAHDYRLPVLDATDFFAEGAYLKTSLGPKDVVIDHMITIGPSVKPDHWADFYREAIKKLKPGVTEFIIHLAYDDAETQAITVNHPDWGAAWRQRDFDFFTSAECRKLLEENNVKLVTWRQIGKLIQ
ncbi:MAG TPA: polysaccharide deacetylase family protein [Blastocatellia bacterium]|nr:polysaccharide deacetylase family protein [Blastocatellia bacterium]